MLRAEAAPPPTVHSRVGAASPQKFGSTSLGPFVGQLVVPFVCPFAHLLSLDLVKGYDQFGLIGIGQHLIGQGIEEMLSSLAMCALRSRT